MSILAIEQQAANNVLNLMRNKYASDSTFAQSAYNLLWSPHTLPANVVFALGANAESIFNILATNRTGLLNAAAAGGVTPTVPGVYATGYSATFSGGVATLSHNGTVMTSNLIVPGFLTQRPASVSAFQLETLIIGKYKSDVQFFTNFTTAIWTNPNTATPANILAALSTSAQPVFQMASAYSTSLATVATQGSAPTLTLPALVPSPHTLTFNSNGTANLS